MRLSWRQKLYRPTMPKLTRLDKPFAGVPAGALLYVSTPREIEQRIRAVPPGDTIAIEVLRDELALANDADATCPTTTSIYLRTIAEAALDDIADGADWKDVTPFWRAIDPDSRLASRLTCGPELLRDRRDDETG